MKNKKLYINESYYLCEGIWINTEKKKLVDEKDADKILDINKFEDQVVIFEREIKEWLYHPMISLVSEDINNQSSYLPFKNAIFILFCIFSYIEKIQRYKDGRPYTDKDSDSVRTLKAGFKKIFPNISGSNKIDNILKSTRHKMMHEGMVGDKVLLNYGANKDVEYLGSNNKIDCIKINPHLVLNTIAKDFDEYLAALKSNSANKKLVDNFTNVFIEVYKDEIDFFHKKS